MSLPPPPYREHSHKKHKMAAIEERIADGQRVYRVKIRLKGYPSESATFKRKSDAKRSQVALLSLEEF